MDQTTPTISQTGFYQRIPTKTLQKMQKGYEFYFDQAHAGRPGYPSTAWLGERLRLVNALLEDRRADGYNNSKEGKAAYKRWRSGKPQ